MRHSFETRFTFRNSLTTPLGKLTNAGIISGGRGVPANPLRVYDSYAVVYLLEGGGVYQDSSGYKQRVTPGDLIVVFPELAHSYEPGPREIWTELHLIFNGPLFDWMRAAGILNPARPVYHLEPIDYWLGRMLPYLEAPYPMTVKAKCREVGRLVSLLTEICAVGGSETATLGQPDWLFSACSLLEEDLAGEMNYAEVAARLGLSYQTFRKQFRQHTKVAPAQYRLARRIAAACELIQFARMSNKQVAENLGFSDEFHFSKRFKQATGLSPREFRRQSEQ